MKLLISPIWFSICIFSSWSVTEKKTTHALFMEINGVMKNKQNRKRRHFPIFFFLHQKLRKPKASPLLIKSYYFPSSTALLIFLFFFFFYRNTIGSLFVHPSWKEAKRKREGSHLLTEMESAFSWEFRRRKTDSFFVQGMGTSIGKSFLVSSFQKV